MAYVIFEVPSNMRVSIAIVRAETSLLTSNRLLMKIKPSIYLSTIVWVWGCAIVGMSQATDSRAFVAGRFFLGMIEAGLFPGAVFLLSCWYTKREIGKSKSGMVSIYSMLTEPFSRQEGLHLLYLRLYVGSMGQSTQ